MIHAHLVPETPALGPVWACAQIRLLRPFRHASVRRRVAVTTGWKLPTHRVDVVVMQRAGPPDMATDELHHLVREIRRRDITLVVDIDDDLLAPHLDEQVEQHLDGIRPNVRFLLREADVVVASTPILAQRLARFNRSVAVWRNALDESLLPEVGDTGGADLGYFGTHSHLFDLLDVVPSLERTFSRARVRPTIEFCGVTHDARLTALLTRCGDVTLRDLEVQYESFHAMLAYHARWKVGIAPLRRCTFNDSKSDIKVLDYAAAGMSAVVSDGPVYADWAQGETVLRASAEDFGDAVLELIQDGKLRSRIVGAAREELFAKRSLTASAAKLVDIVEGALSVPRENAA
ncbi:hypothetical protein KTR66_24240 [Roseococcus sp. SDR]|uniref:hypothetical protein n=1 Tax=Roseococcus sp. SDR TaxID=2835532 RepID=UPI001BCE58A4|nr:hypothetical protein [Roseococcus sp. SDR]MBS7793114.1 hypothetical protein [Roseococcus sp. SDR]MBV1848428.1 hypothetical protein [Roseococcus sp. SDR]